MSKSRRSGLTLVEVMISMAVLGFVLLAFMSTMSSATTFSASTREGLLATYDLQSAVEDSVGIAYTTFKNTYTDGPTFQGKSNGVNYAPSPSSHPLAKYWSTDSVHPRALQEEMMWMETLGSTTETTTYRIHVRWKSHKGFYQEDQIVMQRASR